MPSSFLNVPMAVASPQEETRARKDKVNMGKYVYKISNEEVSRDAFARFVAEECEPQVSYMCGFGVESADYKKGEAVTKQMQGRAYRDYKKSLEWGRPRKSGSADVIYCGVKRGCLRVEYWPA